MFNRNILNSIFKISEKISYNLPSLLSESSILSKNVLEGLHSTRFAGKGDSFWQFREYQQGDTVSNIDWRKSASTEKILIKEKEKEIRKDIYIYFDKSKSMYYKSDNKTQNKFFISVLLTLTLCRLFSRSTEEVYIFNSKNIPINCSSNIKNFNLKFLEDKNIGLPAADYIKKKSLLVIFSDFFYDTKELSMLIKKLKNKNVIGYLIQILDPNELKFEFKGCNQLIDMETKEKLLLNNSQLFFQSYKNALKQMRTNLHKLCYLNNWKDFTYTTNNTPSTIMLDIANNIIVNRR